MFLLCIGKSSSSEPPNKRLRGRRPSENGTISSKETEEVFEVDLQDIDKIVYFTELIIFGNERECLLVDGEYELVLHDKGIGKQRKRKQMSWEAAYNGKVECIEFNTGDRESNLW